MFFTYMLIYAIIDACLQISINLYEEFIQKVSLFKGCSSRFIKQIVRRSLLVHT